MATDQIDVDDVPADVDAATEEQPSAVSSPARSKKLKILGLLLVITTVYVVVGHFLLPQPATTPVDVDNAGDPAGGDDVLHNVKKVEVPLGDGWFNTTNEQAIDGSSVHVRFKLHVTVAKGYAEEFDRMANDVNKNRVKEAVVEVCRGSSRDDLRDPGLSVMKRKIREKVNRLIGSTAIIDVVISDYTTMEQ